MGAASGVIKFFYFMRQYMLKVDHYHLIYIRRTVCNSMPYFIAEGGTATQLVKTMDSWNILSYWVLILLFIMCLIKFTISIRVTYWTVGN